MLSSMTNLSSSDTKLVKIAGVVSIEVRRAAKIAATEAGILVQDWVAEAVLEKLARDRRVIPIHQRH